MKSQQHACYCEHHNIKVCRINEWLQKKPLNNFGCTLDNLLMYQIKIPVKSAQFVALMCVIFSLKADTSTTFMLFPCNAHIFN